ncbi:unnamed protein product, partial [Adineta steineri]
MSYRKQQNNRDHLLYLDCTWRSANWSLMKEILGQLDAICNASQRIIELQESAQILLNIQTNTNNNNNSGGNNNNNTSTSIISTTTTNGNTSTTTNIRQTTNIHELRTIVKTWKSRLPLINDSLSFWNDIFTWRELQYGTISSQSDKDINGT